MSQIILVPFYIRFKTGTVVIIHRISHSQCNRPIHPFIFIIFLHLHSYIFSFCQFANKDNIHKWVEAVNNDFRRRSRTLACQYINSIGIKFQVTCRSFRFHTKIIGIGLSLIVRENSKHLFSRSFWNEESCEHISRILISTSIIAQVQHKFIHTLRLKSGEYLLHFLIIGTIRISIRSGSKMIINQIPNLLISPSIYIVIEQGIVLHGPGSFYINSSDLCIATFDEPLSPISI